MSIIHNSDYFTNLNNLKEKALDFSDGVWSNYDKDIGETLLKFLAATGHTIDYYYKKYIDNLVLPCNNSTSRNLIWELTGYKPPYIKVDYLMIQLYWPNCGLLSYVPLYMYTPFKVTADGVDYTFICAEDYLIPPKTTKTNVALVEGTLESITVDYTKVVNNKIKLCEEEIDYDLVKCIISGNSWEQVRNVFYHPTSEKIYSLHKEEDGIYLYLNENWITDIDSYDKSFIIYFVKSKSTFPDVTEDCISIKFDSELLDTSGVDVSSNYRIFPMPAADIGNILTPTAVEGDRILTTADYTEKSLQYPGILSSTAYSWDTQSVVREPFKVVVIAAGPTGNLRKSTKLSLQEHLQKLGSPLISVEVLDPKYLKHYLTVKVDIGEAIGTLSETQIKLAITLALEDFYKIGNLSPGEQIQEKDLVSLILRCDEKILFADVKINNKGNPNPFALPIFGDVIILTSVTALLQSDRARSSEIALVSNVVNGLDSGQGKEYRHPIKELHKTFDLITPREVINISGEKFIFDKAISKDSKQMYISLDDSNNETSTSTEENTIQKFDSFTDYTDSLNGGP